MTTEYTYCPGYQFGKELDRPCCLSLVKVMPGDLVNYCCIPCFETSWGPIQDSLWGKDPEFVDHKHSLQCTIRQNERITEAPVTDRVFKTMGRMPDGTEVHEVR